MGATIAIARREFAAYFATPLASVFLCIFLALAGALTFYLGNFFERGRADLQAFFTFHPWLYLFLIPAIAMRLWAEERRSGTIELLLTLPVSTAAAVIGKFVAAWAFCGVALILTVPLWITVTWLGNPDHGVILASYLGSWLMAGAFLAVGQAVSALTKNQVIAFVIAAAVCFVITLAGSPLVQAPFSGWAPASVLEALTNLSFLTRFQAVTRGVIDATDLVYFASVIGTFLVATVAIVDHKKAD
ncbi:MAG: ABC transporter permease [Alphaproteobacteria bacterium]|nr:MAG: ABC transporter permease [Alphaproteobacteria bacterium]